MRRKTPFAKLVETFQQLERTSSGSKMIDILASLLARLSPGEARQAAYFLKGKMAPDYEAAELGMAEKLVVRALAGAYGVPLSRVEAALRKTGDLGGVAAQFARLRHSSSSSSFTGLLHLSPNGKRLKYGVKDPPQPTGTFLGRGSLP
jgi:DNA ligase-1